jgi:hypothetical protein
MLVHCLSHQCCSANHREATQVTQRWGFLPTMTSSQWAQLPEELFLMVLDRLGWAPRHSAECG